MNSKDIFEQLYKAETEEEVTNILVNNRMTNVEDWKPYGGIESNYSIIGNQASSAERGLIEKQTNSVDAILTRMCYERGIDPKSEEAPKTTAEALYKFLNIENGTLSMAKEKELGNNILMMATSEDCKPTEKYSRTNPNIILFDTGEGQTPAKLEKTILSLLKANKKDIGFVQGNYNQGGSGALLYCGDRGYCLIVSKRSTKIPSKFIDEDDMTNDKWGWTLIRKEIRSEYRDPIYTYYAPNGQIPMIEDKVLKLLPEELSSKDSKEYLDYSGPCKAFIPYKVDVDCGTAMKMYNYKLSKKGPLIGSLKYDLASCINDTYIPIRFVDCRKNNGNNSYVFRGFKKIIESDEQNKTDPNEGLVHSKIDASFKIDDQEVLVHIYCCNKRKSSDLTAKKLVEGEKSIKFCLGQQFQGGLTSRLINSAGLGVIQDLILMIVEFPNISSRFRSDLFMTDRERLYNKKPKRDLEQKLKEILSESDELKDFRYHVVKANVEVKDRTVIKDILKDWVKKDPTITKLLLGGDRLYDANVGEGEKKKPPRAPRTPRTSELEVETKYYPTYFNPLLKANKKVAYIGESLRLQFKTDAKDDFFNRYKDKGVVKIRIDGLEQDGFTKMIKNGKATFLFSKKILGTKCASKIIDVLILSCDGKEFSHTINLDIRERNKKSDVYKNNNELAGLPRYQEVEEEDWISNMDESSAVVLAKDIDGETYYINMDNASLKEKLSSLEDEAYTDAYKQVYTYMMLFLAIGIRNNSSGSIDSDLDEKNGICDEIALVTKQYAKFIFLGERLMDGLKKKLDINFSE